MFFLGHMCWAYVFSRAASRLTAKRASVQLLFVCGVLPDVDLLLGIEHGGITHSIAFWATVYIPILLLIGPRAGLPYFAATAQHFLFGDFIAGRYKILLPFSNGGYGLGLGITSPISLSLEVLGFAIFIAFAYFTGDLKPLFAINPTNLLSILPAAAMAASYWNALGMRTGPWLSNFEAIQALFGLILFSSFLMGIAGRISEIRRGYGGTH
jgi:hypothetical protein